MSDGDLKAKLEQTAADVKEALGLDSCIVLGVKDGNTYAVGYDVCCISHAVSLSAFGAEKIETEFTTPPADGTSAKPPTETKH